MNENQIIHPVHTSPSATHPAAAQSGEIPATDQPLAQSMAEPLDEPMGEAMEEMPAATTQAEARAKHVLDRAEAYMRQNPLPVILGTVALGMLIGWAAGRRPEPTARERYIEEPAIRARDALLGVLSPLAKRLRDQYGRVRVGVEDTLSPMASMDAGSGMGRILQRTGRFLRNLRFW